MPAHRQAGCSSQSNPGRKIWGVSIDFAGHVWAVPSGGTRAYRLDPETHEIFEVNGLNGPYTYSDMTGYLLNAVAPTG